MAPLPNPNRPGANRLDRRSFARKMAVGALTGAALTTLPQTAESQQPPAETPPPQEPPAPQLDAADHLLAALSQQQKLPEAPEQRAAILGDLRYIVQRSQLLAAYPLTNADEPAPLFSAWRAD